jgi:ribosome-associated translation inhibitor RaiA
MQIQVHTQGFDTTPAIDAYARKEVGRNLVNAQDHVTAVDVYLSDINGPRGGEDKKALIRIRLDSRLVVKIEKVHTDLYVAMSGAARRARHTVKRTLRKQGRMQKSILRKLRQLPAEFKGDGRVDRHLSDYTSAGQVGY